MNYLTEERKNALASEYVLGTLHGRARVRFQRLLMQHRALRHVLWQWESRLNLLGTGLPDVQPRAEVWDNIQRQLGFIERSITTDNAQSEKIPTQNVIAFPSPKVRSWQWLAGTATAAAILLAVLLVSSPFMNDRTQTQIAVVQSEKAQALWSIELDNKSLTVSATASLQTQADKDYELWMIAADGRPPVSLGLLPKQGKLTLARNALFDQVKVAALAVSLEPLGGSPNGKPTQVLYTTELVTL